MIQALYRTPVAILPLVALMWASNAIIAQLAVGEIPPFALVFLRWAMVAAAMLALYGRELRAHWPAIRARMGLMALMSVCGFTVFNSLFYVASAHTSGINMGILQGAIPMMVMLGAFFAYGDRITATQAVGVALTLVGVATVASQGDVARLAALAINEGDLLMLLAVAFYAIYTVALRARPDVPGVVLFAFFAVVAAISAAPLAIWEITQPGYQWPTVAGWGLTLLVAVFPSCFAQILFLRGVDLIGPGRAGVYINLVPIFAAILAILILGETFALYHAVALVCVLGGIWLAQRSQ